jgi:hypothetical protein
VIVEARVAGRTHRLVRGDGAAEYQAGPFRVSLDPASWTVVAADAGGAAEGEALDLSTCALLIALLHAEPALPPLSESSG